MKYYIIFNGVVSIDANSKDDAEEKFWKGLVCPTEKGYDDYYDVDMVISDDEEGSEIK